jgi:inhibitor of cysteine peptidase
VTVTLTEASNGEAIEIRKGDTIDLSLHENATTGFRWQVVRADGLVEESAADQEPPPHVPEEHHQLGAGGARRFRFCARTPGTGRLELKLWREFEGEPSVSKRFGSDITIAD